MDYDTLDQYLGDRAVRPVKGKVSTHIVRVSGESKAIAVRYHWTSVVVWYPDGRCEANSGGYKTATTKARINDYLPAGTHLVQEHKQWYICYDGGHRVPFTDRMTVQSQEERTNDNA